MESRPWANAAYRDAASESAAAPSTPRSRAATVRASAASEKSNSTSPSRPRASSLESAWVHARAHAGAPAALARSIRTAPSAQPRGAERGGDLEAELVARRLGRDGGEQRAELGVVARFEGGGGAQDHAEPGAPIDGGEDPARLPLVAGLAGGERVLDALPLRGREIGERGAVLAAARLLQASGPGIVHGMRRGTGRPALGSPPS